MFLLPHWNKQNAPPCCMLKALNLPVYVVNHVHCSRGFDVRMLVFEVMYWCLVCGKTKWKWQCQPDLVFDISYCNSGLATMTSYCDTTTNYVTALFLWTKYILCLLASLVWRNTTRTCNCTIKTLENCHLLDTSNQ